MLNSAASSYPEEASRDRFHTSAIADCICNPRGTVSSLATGLKSYTSVVFQTNQINIDVSRLSSLLRAIYTVPDVQKKSVRVTPARQLLSAKNLEGGEGVGGWGVVHDPKIKVLMVMLPGAKIGIWWKSFRSGWLVSFQFRGRWPSAHLMYTIMLQDECSNVQVPNWSEWAHRRT